MLLSTFFRLCGRKFLLIALISSLLLGIGSCEYSLHDLYQNPTQADAGDPQVNLIELNLDQDTVYLYADRNVTFRFTSSNQEIRSIRYIVNGEVKDTVNSAHGSFLMVMNDFNTGIYDLAIQVITGNGTGSIAEQLGAEGYLVENHWVLVVIRHNGDMCTHRAEQGYLRLDFPAMHGSDLMEYIVYRTDGNGKKHELGRTRSNHFIDSCYVGEGGDYSVEAVLTSGQVLFWGYWILERELPKISFSATESNHFFFYWTKSRYYNAIAAVKAYASNTIYGTFNLIHTSVSPSDSICYLNNYKFGDEFSTRIELVPKPYSFTYIPDFNEYYMVDEEVMAGFRFANYIFVPNLIIPAEINQILFSDEEAGLVKYSLTDLSVKQSIRYNHAGCDVHTFSDLSVSPAGKFFTAHVCDFSQVYSASTSDITSCQVRSLGYLTGQYSPAIPVSDTHIGLVNSIIGGIYLFNFDTQSVLAEYTHNPTTSSGVCISSNADYMIFYDYGIYKLMHYANHQFTELQTYDPDTYHSFEFSRAEADQFSYWNGQTFSIIRASDQVVLSTIDITGEKYLAMDYKNHEVLTAKGQHLLVRSTDTGELLHDVPVNNTNIYDYYHCSISDHKILSNRGILYFL